MANIISELKSGGIFNNSIVMLGGELGNTSHSKNHTHHNSPTVLAGNLGGTIKTGNFFQLPGHATNSCTTNHTSILTAIGRGTGALKAGEKWGDPSYAQEPFNGLV